MLVGLMACGGSTGGSGSRKPPPSGVTPETVKVCASACAKRTECVKESDEAVCNEQCANGPLGRKIATLRREVVEDLVACLDSSTCGDLKRCRGAVIDKANEREKENAAEKPAVE